MKKIICKVLMFLFPEKCEASRRRVAARRAERVAAMDSMLAASRRMCDKGRDRNFINESLRTDLGLYNRGHYRQCADLARTF